MTSIDAISISGIRSFDPDPHNAQRIVFKKPLTVILGKNGAGKTTVIEALLNACTGAMPPGCGEKVSFIYDPKVVGKSSVKAHIRLDITAKGGSKVSVIRKLESAKKNTKLSFTTLDSVIVVNDAENDKAVSHSHKASDCDRMVPEFLGVSKAVLEHVIFCHQEDSNWPLQSPADVKAKFDDIFASSGYVAALDKLKEVMKGYKQQRDADSIALREYRGKKEEAARLREQIAKDRATSQTLYQQSREVGPKIRQVADAIAALDSIAYNAEQTSREIATINGRIEERDRTNKDIANRGFLKNVQQHQFQNPQQTLVELKQTRDTFQQQTRTIQEERRDAENKIQLNREAKDRIEKAVNQLTVDIEFRQRGEREHKRRVEELKETLKLFSDTFVVGDANLDDKALLRVERKLQEDLAAANAALANEKIAAEQSTGAAKEDLDKLHREFDALPPQRQHAEDTIRQSNRTLNEKRDLLAHCIKEGTTIITNANVPSSVAPSFMPVGGEVVTNAVDGTTSVSEGNAGRIVEYFETTIADLEQRIAAANATRQAGAWHREEERLSAELTTINSTLTALRAEMSARSLEAEDTKRLTILQEQLAEQNEKFSRQLADATNFLQLAQQAQFDANVKAGRVTAQQQQQGPAITPSGSPLSIVTLAFETLLKNREGDLGAAHTAAQSADRNVAVATEKLSKKREELSAAERSLVQQQAMFKSAQQSLPAILGPDATCESFEKIVALAQQQLMEAKQGVSSLKAMQDCYASFISTAQTDHKCSVCDRELTDAGLVEFVKSNEERHKNAPQQLEQQNQLCASLTRSIAELKRVEPVVQTILRLTASIPQLRTEVSQLTAELEELQSVYNTFAQRRHDAESSFRDANAFVQSNIAALNSKKSEISTLAVQEQAVAAKLHRMREQRQQQMGGGGGGQYLSLSLKDIEGQHAGTMDQFNAVSSRLQDVRREKLAEERGLQQDPLKASLELHQKGLFALKPLIRQCQDVSEDIRVAQANSNKAQETLHVLANRKSQLQQQLDLARSNLEKVQQNAKKRVESAQIQVQTHEKSAQTVAQASAQVKQYITNNEAQQLNTSRDKLTAVRAELDREVANIAKLEKQIRDALHFLDNQNRVQQGIESQIAYFSNIEDARMMQANKANLEAQLTRLKDDNVKHAAALLGSRYDPTMTVQALKSVLHSQHVALAKDESHQLGTMAAVQNAIKNAEAQLSHPDLERADDTYASTYVKLQTTDLVVKDLEKYYLALEKAIQSYHQEKIAQINQLIAEYWRQTYRGSDIDTIELKAEDEVTASGAINTRKSYKYRLVMRKGNAELDMRGRCSAGQKVLASVVIRLALSEAFCCDCGVLALDEPTTNLDEDNALSLASALKDLIDARRNASNFQLIVITHDEAFVRALGGQNVVDSYYFVHKDRAGEFSVIEELSY